jgi:tetratricopeptide (TPR) repeat protein
MDPERVQELLSRFFKIMDRIIQSYGGHVLDHAGDAVTGVFGAPIAHGNDAERAVGAALNMHQAVAGLMDGSGRSLRLHIGIASGEVVAAFMTGGALQRYSVTGDTVNLAARLNALAKPGQTLASGALHRTVANLVDAESHGERPVKGLDRPVHVWSIRGLRRLRADQLPFIGREAELRKLTGMLDTVLEAGIGTAVCVRGEAGIGKSRLTEEMRAQAQTQGFACHVGRVLDFGVCRGQDALPVILRDLLRLPELLDEPITREGLARASAIGLFDHEEEMFVRDLLDLPQPPQFRVLFDAMDNETRARRATDTLVAIVRRATQLQPCLLVVEDIHWASDSLLRALVALGAVAAQCPLILVMTSRTERDPLEKTWPAATPGSELVTIDLGRLRKDEAQLLASELIERSSQVALQCIERAEGNPLFLEQLLRGARESGSPQIPGSVQSLILARLDRLPPRDKQALQSASAIGKRFSLESLQAVCGDHSYTPETIITADLARPDGHDYLFSHALIQEGVYSSLLKSRRRELHLQAATWFRDREPVVYAEHLDRAEDPAAAQAYLEAARGEKQAYHPERALQLLDRGSALAPEPVVRFGLLVERGELLPDLGRAGEAISDFERAGELAASGRQRCQAWIGTVAAMRMSDRYADALTVLDKAQVMAETLALDLEAAQIHHLRGNLYFPLGKIPGCLKEQEQALQLARKVASPEWEARALSGLGDAYFAAGRMLSAYRCFDECVAISRTHSLGKVEVANLMMLGVIHVSYLGPADVGLKLSQQAVDLARKVGQPRPLILAQQMCATALLMLGESQRAQPYAEAARDLAQAIGATRFVPDGMLVVAACLWQQGRREETLPLLRQALSLAREHINFCGPPILGALAYATDDLEERNRCLEEAERVLAGGCIAHYHMVFYSVAISMALEHEDWAAAERYTSRMEATFAQEPTPLVGFCVRCARAVAAAGRGERGPVLTALLEEFERQARVARMFADPRAVEQALARVRG